MHRNFDELQSVALVCVPFLTIGYNGSGLGEGGEFTHQLLYEAPKFKFTKNCPTKSVTATCAKPGL
jgi:hypothetical protein